MTHSSPRDAATKVRRLFQLATDLRRGRGFSVTRLTGFKSLCKDPEAANHFVTFLAHKTLERVEHGKKRAGRRPGDKVQMRRRLMAEALEEMDAWMDHPTEPRRERLWELFTQMKAEQNEYKNIRWGAVRIIHDSDLLLVEYAVNCLLHPHEAEYWAYQTARHYAERYDAHHPSGLVPSSAPLVQDIAAFWAHFFGIDPARQPAPARRRKGLGAKQASCAPGHRGTPGASSGTTTAAKPRFTNRQGQFLAFIHLYWKLQRQGPAEADLVRYFRLTPPSVHSMIVKLSQLGLVTREPGVARSVRVAIPEDKIPKLE